MTAGAETGPPAPKEEERVGFPLDIIARWGRFEAGMLAYLICMLSAYGLLLWGAVVTWPKPVWPVEQRVAIVLGMLLLIAVIGGLVYLVFTWEKQQVKRELAKINKVWYRSELVADLADQAIEAGATTIQEPHASLRTETQFRDTTATRDRSRKRRWLVGPGLMVADRGEGITRRARQAGVAQHGTH